MNITRKFPIKGLWICLIVGSGIALYAGPERMPPLNEDVRYIIEFQRAQRLADLADRLALTPDQVTALKQAKSQLDDIRAEAAPQVDAAEASLAEAAKQIRTQLENGGMLTEQDREVLREQFSAIHDLREEAHQASAEVVGGLAGLLTEDQRDIVKQWFQESMASFMAGDDPENGSLGGPQFGFKHPGIMGRHHKSRGAGPGAGPGMGSHHRGGLRGPGESDGPGGRMRMRFLEHVLLDDAFLSNYQ